MGFSSKLKAHKNILTLETLKFICEYLVDGNARQAAIRTGIPETYAGRMGSWLKKQPMVIASVERDLDEDDLEVLQKAIAEIESIMEECRELLGLDEG